MVPSQAEFLPFILYLAAVLLTGLVGARSVYHVYGAVRAAFLPPAALLLAVVVVFVSGPLVEVLDPVVHYGGVFLVMAFFAALYLSPLALSVYAHRRSQRTLMDRALAEPMAPLLDDIPEAAAAAPVTHEQPWR